MPYEGSRPAEFRTYAGALYEQPAYVTADPDRSDRGGLAAQDGCYALVLGDGCDGAVPGVNVVLEQEHMSDTPCGKNPAGECDVAWA